MQNLITSFSNLVKVNKTKIVRYLTSGGISAFVDYALFLVLLKLGFSLFTSVSIAYITGFIINFSLNKFWSFSDKNRSVIKDQFMLYAALAFFNYFFTLTFINISSLSNFSLPIAKLVALGITVTWNFILYKSVIFGNKKDYDFFALPKKLIYKLKPLHILILLVILVIGGNMFTQPWADEKHFSYFYSYVDDLNPLEEISISSIAATKDRFFLGVFRPISFFILYTEKSFLGYMATTLHVPIYILAGILRLGVLAALFVSLIKLHKQYNPIKLNTNATRGFSLALAVTLPATLLLRNIPSHPINLFTVWYFSAVILALSGCIFMGKLVNSSEKIRVTSYLKSLLFGVAAASMVELSYVLIPVTLVHIVLLIAYKSKITPLESAKRIYRHNVFKVWLVMVVGFIAVLLPTKLYATYVCSNYAVCYEAASASINFSAIRILFERIFAPIFIFAKTAKQAPDLILGRYTPYILGAAVLGLITLITARQKENTPIKKPKKNYIYLLVLFTSLLVSGALIAAMSADVQSDSINYYAWRDTAITWPAWAAILATLSLLLPSRKIYTAITAIGLTGLMIISSTYNHHYQGRVSARNDGIILKEIDLHFVTFSQEEAQDAERCSLLNKVLNDTQTEKEFNRIVDTYIPTLNSASLEIHGTLYCENPDENRAVLTNPEVKYR